MPGWNGRPARRGRRLADRFPFGFITGNNLRISLNLN
jgi:hypothetical protein